MMQMLDAGGLPVLSDGERKADTDNPKGYLEWERIKQLPKDPGLIAEAEGKVVKVISQLVPSLPMDRDYRIIFMQRPLPEVLKSQDEMLRRRGNAESITDNAKGDALLMALKAGFLKATELGASRHAEGSAESKSNTPVSTAHSVPRTPGRRSSKRRGLQRRRSILPSAASSKSGTQRTSVSRLKNP